jgi:hypothetical protein
VGTAIHGKFVIDSSPASAKSYINMKPKKILSEFIAYLRNGKAMSFFVFEKAKASWGWNNLRIQGLKNGLWDWVRVEFIWDKIVKNPLDHRSIK